MLHNKQKTHTFFLKQSPVIVGWAAVAGCKEADGPLGDKFDITNKDAYWGEKTWEQAEKRMQQLALDTLASKCGLKTNDFDLVFSGDLLNQCIGSSFTLRNTGIPHLGLYGACSTMAESLLLASMAVDGGYFENAVAMTSSHFAASERQYRFPLGYGGQRTPTSQWTATGSGAALVCAKGNGLKIECCTVGTITDLGITDANNMGAAMAPAAFETIKKHLCDTGRDAGDYDMIVTGDLGQYGQELLLTLAAKEGLCLGGKLSDCGVMLFDNLKQDVHAGGSGCGCSAITLCGDLLDKLNSGKLNKILFCGTGALMSPTSAQQGLPIPGIAHAVSILGRC